MKLITCCGFQLVINPECIHHIVRFKEPRLWSFGIFAAGKVILNMKDTHGEHDNYNLDDKNLEIAENEFEEWIKAKLKGK